MKTARELGISEEEYLALLKVRAGLAEGRYTHVKEGCDPHEFVACAFNMDVTMYNPSSNSSVYPSCGQIGCIGGWVAIEIKHPDPTRYVDHIGRQIDSPLAALYFPPQSKRYEDITPAQAVQGIDNFLNFGHPRWEEFLPDDIYEDEFEDE